MNECLKQKGAEYLNFGAGCPVSQMTSQISSIHTDGIKLAAEPQSDKKTNDQLSKHQS